LVERVYDSSFIDEKFKEKEFVVHDSSIVLCLLLRARAKQSHACSKLKMTKKRSLKKAASLWDEIKKL